jgi:hypothetical protein
MERKAAVKQGILDKSLIRPRTEVHYPYYRMISDNQWMELGMYVVFAGLCECVCFPVFGAGSV